MIRWEPWQREDLRGEVGTLSVPEYEGGPGIPIRLVRLAAPDPAAPTTLFLTGGPGISAVSWAEHAGFRVVFAELAARTHLVLVDQRGTGPSAVRIDTVAPDPAEGGLVHPLALYRRDAEVRLVGLRAREVPPSAYTPLTSAQDLVRVADALAVERVNLLGHSYGTHLAMATARLAPERIGRVGLLGFEGPDHTLKLPSQFDRQLERLDRLSPGLLEDLDAVLLGDEWTVKVGRKTYRVGPDGLRHLVAGWSGLSNRFRRLPELLRATRGGDLGPLTKAVEVFFREWPRPTVFFLNDAASGVSPARAARIAAEAPASRLRNAGNLPFPEIRSDWGQVDLGDAYREPLVSDHPFLIVTGSLDGFTPTSNAREGMAALPNAHHIEVENAAHNDLLSAPRTRAAMNRFLADGSPPSFGTDAIAPPSLVVGNE